MSVDEHRRAGEVPGDAEGVPDDVPHGEGERDGGLAPALLPGAGQRRRRVRRRAARPALLQRRDAPGPAARRGRLDAQHRQLRHTPRGELHTRTPAHTHTHTRGSYSQHTFRPRYSTLRMGTD